MKSNLSNSLKQFKKLYGYKVSEELFKWIFLSELSEGNRTFKILNGKNDTGLRLIPQFVFQVDDKSILEPTDISFVFSTSPYILVGTTTGGHYFYASTIQKKNKSVYYIDSEGPSLIVKDNTTASKLISEALTEEEKELLKKVKKELSEFISKDAKSIDEFYLAPKLERPNTWTGDINKHVEEGRFGYDLFNLRKVLIKRKRGNLNVKTFIDHKDLLNFLENNDSDYYSIDSATGRINCEIIRTSIIYFFAGHLDLLHELLDSANENIKGDMFLSFVSSFKVSLDKGKDFSFSNLKDDVKMKIE